MCIEACQLARSNGYVMMVENGNCERTGTQGHSALVSPEGQKENSRLFQGIWTVRVGTEHAE